MLCGGYTHDVRLSYASAVSFDFSISYVQFISCIYAGKNMKDKTYGFTMHFTKYEILVQR